MSKAFTSEETPDDPIVIPPRAPLPPGVPNYVTPRGLALLRAELAALEHERTELARVANGGPEHERRVTVATGRHVELASRIASAQVVDPRAQPHDAVRFGATVTVRDDAGVTQRFTIVGVDEAAPAEGRIAFLAPVARALTGLAVGDSVTLETAGGERELTVEAIAYGDARGFSRRLN